MGGAVSAGEDNDNLVENLVNANYIRSTRHIDIFRAVDRGHYYLKGQRNSAYHDIAWKFNHLHLSAPCIYSEVMEHIDLQPGMSFLNLGSGTGYLSTMAGLILGPYGINHGIEIHGDVVDYAREKLKEFMIKAPAFDRFEFCPPHFEVGNCLLLPPDTPGYDRVYCGAACPPEYANYLMNLLNIGGKLVLPLEDQLQVKTRTGEQEWDSKSALAVSFAHLIIPETQNNNLKTTPIPERNPPSLQQICRFCIRRVIRDRFTVEMPPKKKRKKRERHQSVGIEEHIIARHREVRMRRRRINTIGESGSTRRRRRMNTSGDSDHAESSGDSGDSSDDERDSDDDMEAEEDSKERTDIVDDVIKENSAQNKLANDTNDISLSDQDDQKKDAPSNGLPEIASTTDESRKDDSSASEVPTLRTHPRRYHFRFLRSRPHNRTRQQQQNDETPTTSDRADSSSADVRTETQPAEDGEREGAARERQLVRPMRPSRLAYALIRGLRRRIAAERDVGPRRDGQETIEAEDEEDSAHSDQDIEKEEKDSLDSGSDGDDEVYNKPIAETHFTIAIRKLPLPPKLISFLLYYRQ